jgi:hypothetical protein
MQLSFIARILCLVFCGTALMQLLLECLAWAACPSFPATFAPPKLRRPESLHSGLRAAEQTLFWLALATRLIPWLLVCGLLLPAYLRTEDNLSSERVGLLCPILALSFVGLSFVHLLRLGRAIDASRRCVQRSSPPDRSSTREPNILVHSGRHSLLAVAGIFSANILVSRRILSEGRFSPESLAVAFAHERSHIRHRDNLKLILLTLLPNLPVCTSGRPSLEQRWRLAVEMAADEEGTLGQPARSLLLADMLVTLAREGTHTVPAIMLSLHGSADHLRLRVERLLEPRSPSVVFGNVLSGRFQAMSVVITFATAVIALSLVCIILGHHAAEILFHVL